MEKLSKERIERFNEKGIPLMSIREIHKMETWLKYYDTYVEYLEKYGEQPVQPTNTTVWNSENGAACS